MRPRATGKQGLQEIFCFVLWSNNKRGRIQFNMDLLQTLMTVGQEKHSLAVDPEVHLLLALS